MEERDKEKMGWRKGRGYTTDSTLAMMRPSNCGRTVSSSDISSISGPSIPSYTVLKKNLERERGGEH